MKARLVAIGIGVILCAAGAAYLYRDANVPGRTDVVDGADGMGGGGETLSLDTSDRQVILSLGEEAGDIAVSWKGGDTGPEVLRISEDEGGVSSARALEATGYRILKSDMWRYHVKLEDLTPGKTYFYEIGEADASGRFTVPDDSGDTKFLYLGDVQFEDSPDEYEEWGEMTERILMDNPDLDFAVIGGDMVNSPTDPEQWEAFLGNCRAFSSLPVMTVSGNHEGVRSSTTYQKIFDPLRNGPIEGEFYSFDYGECRFVMMDSSFLTEERREEMGDDEWERYERRVESWLEDILSDSDKAWKIAVIHHPVYGFHDKDTVSPQLRKLWAPILEEHDVKLVFSGHQHMYLRTKKMDGIVYVMGNSGGRVSDFYDDTNSPAYGVSVYSGANYQIVTAGESKLSMTSYNKKGLVIDETVIGRGLDFHVLEFLRGD